MKREMFVLFLIVVVFSACASAPPVNPVEAMIAAPAADPLPISPPAELIGEWRGEMETELFFEQPSSGAEVVQATAIRDVAITIRPDGGAVILAAGCKLAWLEVRQKESVAVLYRDKAGGFLLHGTPPLPDLHILLREGGVMEVKEFFVDQKGPYRLRYPSFTLRKEE